MVSARKGWVGGTPLLTAELIAQWNEGLSGFIGAKIGQTKGLRVKSGKQRSYGYGKSEKKSTEGAEVEQRARRKEKTHGGLAWVLLT
jgi:hypothetical protein